MYAAAGPDMQQEMIEAAIEGRGVTLEEIDSDDEEFEDDEFLTPESQEFEDAEEISAEKLAETRKRARETAVTQTVKKAKTMEQKANLRDQEVAVVGTGVRLQPRGADSDTTSFFRAATGSASAEVAQLNNLSDTQISVDTSVAIFKGMGNALGMLIKFMWYLLGGFTYLVGKVQMSEGSNKDALRIDSPISNTVVMVSGRMNNMWLRPRHATNWVQWLSVFTQIFMTLMGVSYYYQMMNWGLFAAGFEGVGIGYAGYVATKKVLHSDEGEILTGIALEALKGKAYKDMGAKFRSQGAVVNAVGRVAIMLANKSIGKAGPAGAVGSWFIRKGMVTASRREKRAMVRNGIVNITKTMIAAATGMVNPAHQKLHNYGLDGMQELVKTLIPQTRRDYQEQSLKYKLGLATEPPVSEASAVKQWAKAVQKAAKVKEKAKAIVRRHTTEQSLDSIRILLDVEDADYDQVLPVTAGMIAGLEVIGNDLSLAKENQAKVLGLIIDQMHDSALMAAFDRLHAAGHTYGESYDFDVQKVARDILQTLGRAQEAAAMISKLYKQIRGLQQAPESTQTKEVSTPTVSTEKQLLDIVIFIGQMRMQSTARLAERMVMMEELLMQHVYASSDDEDTRRQLQQYFKHFAAMGFHMQQDTHNAIHDAHAVHNTGSTPQRSSSSMDVLRIHSTHRQPPAEIHWDHPQHQQMIDLYQEASAPARNRRDAQKLANNTGYVVRPSIRTEDEEKAYNRQKNANNSDPYWYRNQRSPNEIALPVPRRSSQEQPETPVYSRPVSSRTANMNTAMRLLKIIESGGELSPVQINTLGQILPSLSGRLAANAYQLLQQTYTKGSAPMPADSFTPVKPATGRPTTGSAPHLPATPKVPHPTVPQPTVPRPTAPEVPVDLVPGARAPSDGPPTEVMEDPITRSTGSAGEALEIESLASRASRWGGKLLEYAGPIGDAVNAGLTIYQIGDIANKQQQWQDWRNNNWRNQLNQLESTANFLNAYQRSFNEAFAGNRIWHERVNGEVKLVTQSKTKLYDDVFPEGQSPAADLNGMQAFFLYGPQYPRVVQGMKDQMIQIKDLPIPENKKQALIAATQTRNASALKELSQAWTSKYFKNDAATNRDRTSSYWTTYYNEKYVSNRKRNPNTADKSLLQKITDGIDDALNPILSWVKHGVQDYANNPDFINFGNFRQFDASVYKDDTDYGKLANDIHSLTMNDIKHSMDQYVNWDGGIHVFKRADVDRYRRITDMLKDPHLAAKLMGIQDFAGRYLNNKYFTQGIKSTPEDNSYDVFLSNILGKNDAEIHNFLDLNFGANSGWDPVTQTYKKEKQKPGQPTQLIPGAGVIMDTGTGTHTHTQKNMHTQITNNTMSGAFDLFNPSKTQGKGDIFGTPSFQQGFPHDTIGEIEAPHLTKGSTNTGKIGQAGFVPAKDTTHQGQPKHKNPHIGDSGHSKHDQMRDGQTDGSNQTTPVHAATNGPDVAANTDNSSTVQADKAQHTAHIPNTPYLHLPTVYPEGHPGNADANVTRNAINHPDEEQETFNKAYIMNKLPQKQTMLMMQAKENYLDSLNMAQAMY